MSLKDFGDPLYRPAVGMMILNAENKIFMGQRADQADPAWQMPQGGINPREDVDQAMLRELFEEVGTRDVEIIVKSKKWYRYDFPEHLATRLWWGKYKGQKQIWYALRFRGQDGDINLNTYQPEFREWCWATQEELLERTIPFKRALYTEVFADLWPYVLRKDEQA